MRWLLASITLTLVTHLSHQKKETDDSVTKCWNDYCDYPGLLTKRCPKRGEINRCLISRDSTEINCERMTGVVPPPDKTCKNDFMNECSCGFTNKVDSPSEVEWTAFCDCKMKSSAKTTIGLIVGFVVLIAGCGVCLGKWFLVKRETVQFEIREREEQSKFDTYGDYSSASQSQGQRNSAQTVENKNSLSAGPGNYQPIVSPGGRSVSQNPRAGRGARVSPNPAAGRGIRGPVSPNPTAGRGRPAGGRPVRGRISQ